MLVVMDFLTLEALCVQSNNIPTVLVRVKFTLISGYHKLQMSDNLVIRKFLDPGSMK